MRISLKRKTTTDAFKTYRQALDYLFHFTDYERMHRVTKATSVFGLSRMNKLLEHCGNPHLALRTVHIAGTKGKGSTAAMLASVLRAAGLKVGLYTSPHIYDVRERIQVDGEWIPEHTITRVLNELHPYLQVAAKGGDTYAPTFFETFTVIAFLHFLRCGTDIAVIEVGLGGRLDATNVLRPLACAITPVSFDHTDKLGNTLAEIAGEKAGIIKERVPVVSGVQRPAALEVIRAKCAELRAPLRVVGVDVTVVPAGRGEAALECGDSIAAFKAVTQSPHSKDARGISVQTWRRSISDVIVPLAGRHQRENAATAVGLAELLSEQGAEIGADCIRRGIASVDWPGRIQTVAENPEIIVDGAHNPASVGVLCDVLDGLPAKPTVFVVGIAADKDIRSMLALLAPRGDEFIFTATNNPRAARPDDLAAVLSQIDPGKKTHTADSPAAALDAASRLATPADRICVTGSMYLAGDALAALSTGAN